MEDKITLEKVDIVRSRAGISYRRAYELLKETDGDVVRALIRLEEEPRAFTERIQVQGNELIAKLRQIIREGNANRITVKRGGKVLADIPVTAGAVGAVLMPYLAALGVIAVLAARCTIEVERRAGAGTGTSPKTPGPGGGGTAYTGAYTGTVGARAEAEKASQASFATAPAGPESRAAAYTTAPASPRLDAAEEHPAAARRIRRDGLDQ